ncbi:hypothetical protein S7711_10054 [Stachybotrys chartarum IBT 7711]|uniref:Uncharacterized protein n=1 Tax=Stachybotrys chartarum (strain CBS 109288 / IBT 7711) TaxID=1280523 RepID=A0A084AZS7_STACB|nr:hypothetical protein S7711_10054 [Stachybotrys chartarum IBT 7711]
MRSTYLLLAATRSLAQNLDPFDSSQCVDSSAFDSCYDEGTAYGESCVDECENGDVDCARACLCGMWTAQFECIIESCWNKVYSCAYQQFALNYADSCLLGDSSQIPFWPAPSGAPDSCSCNLQNLYDVVIASTFEQTTCLNRVTSELAISDPIQALQNVTGCQCCGASGAISASYNMCPDTDPTLLGVDQLLSLVDSATGGQGFGTCDATLNEFDCIADLQYPVLEDDGEYYADEDLPQAGTGTLSDVGGPLTSAPFGSVTTISILSTSFVLTAAPYDMGSGGNDEGNGNEGDSEEGNGEEYEGGIGGDDRGGSLRATGGSENAAVKTARWMENGVLYDVGNYIHAVLTPEFDLDPSKKERSGLFVENLDLILHHHYVRDESIYAHKRLRVQLALILIVAGATTFADGAFLNEFSHPEQIYELEMSFEKPLKYGKTKGHLIALGRALGYAKRLEFYDIRRGSGRKLNEALNPEE